MTLSVGAGTLALLDEGGALGNALLDLEMPIEGMAAIWSTELMLTRPNLRVLSGLPDDTIYRPGSPGFPGTLHVDDVYDARGEIVLQNLKQYIFFIGEENPASPPRQTFVGGVVDGIKGPDLTRRTWKDTYDGTGLQIRASEWAVFDGFRARNVLDGFRYLRITTETPGLFRATNLWIETVRDDGLEHANLGGEIVDCLFDGMFTFVSGQQIAAYTRNGDDSISVRRTLVRLRALPEVRAGQEGVDNLNLSIDANGDGHGWLWKDPEAIPVHCRDCVFAVERYAVQGTAVMDFMRHAENTYEDVTLLWLAPYTSFDLTVVGAPTGGTYTLLVSVDGGPALETATIAHNASATTIRDKIKVLANVGTGNVVALDAGPFQVTFGAALDGRPVVLNRGQNNLTGGAAPDVVLTPISSYPRQEPLPAGITKIDVFDTPRLEVEAVWDAAVAEWYRRHGVTDWDNVDEYLLLNPLEV